MLEKKTLINSDLKELLDQNSNVNIHLYRQESCRVKIWLRLEKNLVKILYLNKINIKQKYIKFYKKKIFF